MAKALVFEGCPACGTSGVDGLGQVVPAALTRYVTDSLKGGLYGSGGVILSDVVLSKVLPNLSPIVRNLMIGGSVLGVAYYMRHRNPDMAEGLAIGGGSIIVYKLMVNLLKRFVPGIAPTAGYGDLMYEGLGQDVEIEEGPSETGALITEELGYDDGMGVLVPEELGQEEIVI